ncbi:RNA-binding S4 domain-containing protein [Polluticaenibacter yanchengensis]|uniref:RNA-binding S4 domain-containing protein n=1 Tax=Polluticaenibacter yanchengensis TaxID=3014562 RepID=A0ABT4UGJ8_9BACT|nr:RNA-binding S4 domain-containing protein [Chitinophagaceae bacterium LY-5]
MEAKEKVRIDKYLWSIRMYKTRAQAADACDSGKVKLNDNAIKASRAVKLGDVYELRNEGEKKIIKVTGIIEKRVGYPEAIKNYEDITPEDLNRKNDFQVPSFYTGKRLSKTGRPSKEQRRNLDDIMNIDIED